MSFTCIVHVRNAHVMVLVARSSMFFYRVCVGVKVCLSFIRFMLLGRTMKIGGGSIFSNFGRFCSCSCLLLCVRSCRPVLRSLNHWNVIWFSFKTCHFCRCQNSQYTIYSASITTRLSRINFHSQSVYIIFLSQILAIRNRFILYGNLWFFSHNPVFHHEH